MIESRHEGITNFFNNDLWLIIFTNRKILVVHTYELVTAGFHVKEVFILVEKQLKNKSVERPQGVYIMVDSELTKKMKLPTAELWGISCLRLLRLH